MRTITIDYEDSVHITLARPSLADARVRIALANALRKTFQKNADGLGIEEYEGTWCYYVTMLLSAEGTGDRKISVCPSDEETRQLYERWVNETDEALSRLIVSAISQLLAMETAEKKASGASSETTLAKAPIQIP